jgi:hypothetical protein
VFSGHTGEHPVSPRVSELVALEERERLYAAETWRRFEEAVRARRARLVDRVHDLTSRGKTIVGLGAPAKASTICNYCRLGPERVSYVTEVNPLRIGKFLPGVHIPIVDEERMFHDKPDAGILFAWNYHDEIVPKLRSRGFHGEVLLP